MTVNSRSTKLFPNLTSFWLYLHPWQSYSHLTPLYFSNCRTPPFPFLFAKDMTLLLLSIHRYINNTTQITLHWVKNKTAKVFCFFFSLTIDIVQKQNKYTSWFDLNIDTPIEVNTGQREQAWTFMQAEELRIGTKMLKMCLFLSKAENQLGPLGAQLVPCGPPLFA